MLSPRIRASYERFRDCLEEAGLLGDLIEIPNYTNETLIIIEGYGNRPHPTLMRTFIPENLEGVEGFIRAYAEHVGVSTMKVLCDELRSLLEEGNVDG